MPRKVTSVSVSDKEEVLLSHATFDSQNSLTPSPIHSYFGDIWQLGRHRLMCGDSTCADHVQQLMEGCQADLVFTDPPYNVNYQNLSRTFLKMRNDALSQTDYRAFLQRWCAQCKTAIKPTASLYICHAATYQRELQEALEANGFVVRNQLVWAKHHFVLSFARYKGQHELLFYCYVKGQRDRWYGDRSQTTVWRYHKPTRNTRHPTMKPVPLIEKALCNSTQPQDRVLDLFGGSGSTLMACEALDRVAYVMEIEPHYVDAILQRWQTATHQHAQLLKRSDVLSADV